MGDEFYSIIKLVSGEEIFSLIMIDENDGDPVIILQNPVVMKVIHSGQASYIKVKPWMEIPNDDFFVIKLDKVLTMTETKDKKVIELYNNYLSEDSIDVYNPGGRVKPSEKMGYISSVEDARKKLENLFKGLKES
jgi:hypothetical protein